MANFKSKDELIKMPRLRLEYTKEELLEGVRCCMDMSPTNTCKTCPIGGDCGDYGRIPDILIAALEEHFDRQEAEIALLRKIINAIPAAEALLKRKGEWRIERNRRTCSACGYEYYANGGSFAYCPSCGANMKGGE